MVALGFVAPSHFTEFMVYLACGHASLCGADGAVAVACSLYFCALSGWVGLCVFWQAARFERCVREMS